MAMTEKTLTKYTGHMNIDRENTNNKYRPYCYRLKTKTTNTGAYKHGAMTMNRLTSTMMVRGQGMNLVINN